jgi:hypothetical protein
MFITIIQLNDLVLPRTSCQVDVAAVLEGWTDYRLGPGAEIERPTNVCGFHCGTAGVTEPASQCAGVHVSAKHTVHIICI